MSSLRRDVSERATLSLVLQNVSEQKFQKSGTDVEQGFLFRFSPRAGGETTFFSPPEFSFFLTKISGETAFSPRDKFSFFFSPKSVEKQLFLLEIDEDFWSRGRFF